MKVKSESEVTQCPTPSNPMDCSLPGSFVHGICQARVLEWGAIAFSDAASLLLLLLIHFSCVRLCVTPYMAAHQAPPSLGFSRHEHWSGLPFPSPVHEVKSESECAQSCPTLSDPMDCSLPASSVHGIFQARVLQWGAIAFSGKLARQTKKISC